MDTWLPTVISPAIVFVLRFLPIYNMPPLAHWTFPADGIVVFGALVGAFISRFFPRGNASNSEKVIAVVLAFLLSLLGLFYYDYFLNHPPEEQATGQYDTLAFVSLFVLVYPPLGYCFASIAATFFAKSVRKK